MLRYRYNNEIKAYKVYLGRMVIGSYFFGLSKKWTAHFLLGEHKSTDIESEEKAKEFLKNINCEYKG